MPLDRIVALVFLVVSVAYGVAAFNYPLLPFERNMAFLPNTLPMALSVPRCGARAVHRRLPAGRRRGNDG